MEGYFHQKIKVVLMDVIGSKCVWNSRWDWSTHSAASWESHSIFTCELVWKISGLNLVWNYSYMKFFIHEIGVNFLSGIFNLVLHVKFLIFIHFKHVSGVNQVWNRPDVMRIFCTGWIPETATCQECEAKLLRYAFVKREIAYWKHELHWNRNKMNNKNPGIL